MPPQLFGTALLNFPPRDFVIPRKTGGSRMARRCSFRHGWLPFVLGAAVFGAPPVVAGPGRDSRPASPREVLSEFLPEPRTEVLVLATTHLRTLGDAWNPGLVKSLNDALVRFQPQVVVVEAMPPYLVEGLEKLGGNYGEVVRAMAGRVSRLGGSAQGQVAKSRGEAESAAAKLLAELPGLQGDELSSARRRLGCLLVAAYDLPSAVLQWSYLSPKDREREEGLPTEVHRFLQEAVSRPNETYSIAVEVARRVGLQRIAGMDDHSEAAQTLEYWDRLSAELDASPVYQELQKSAFYAESDRRFRQAVDAGDLLPHYLWLASPEFARSDVREQWGALLRTRLESRLDRARLAQWEVRNLRMAAHIRQAASGLPDGRVLVVVGAGHKAWLDHFLAQLYDVRLVPLSELVQQRPAETAGGDGAGH